MQGIREIPCPETGGYCSDPGCSVKHCRIKTERTLIDIANDREASIDRQVEINEAKKEIALEVLKLKKIAPTETLIRELIDIPKVIDEAERRVSARETSVQKLREGIDFKSIPLPKR
jgi:hypothetical protein